MAVFRRFFCLIFPEVWRSWLIIKPVWRICRNWGCRVSCCCFCCVRPSFWSRSESGLLRIMPKSVCCFQERPSNQTLKAEPYQRDQAAIQFALVDEFRQNIGKIRRDRLLVLSTIFSRRPCFTGFE